MFETFAAEILGIFPVFLVVVVVPDFLPFDLREFRLHFGGEFVEIHITDPDSPGIIVIEFRHPDVFIIPVRGRDCALAGFINNCLFVTLGVAVDFHGD